MNSRFFIIFSLSITVAYIVFALYILFFPPPIALEYNPVIRYSFSILIIAYGIFRGYRAVKIYNLHKDENK